MRVSFFADPPIILGVTAVPSLLAVNISWNSTNNNTGIEILDYKLVIIDTKTQRRREIFGINVSNHYVTNLTHNTTYRVMVQARNEIGYGKSVSRNVTTLTAGQKIAQPEKKRPTFLDKTTGFPMKWRLKRQAKKFHTADVSLPSTG